MTYKQPILYSEPVKHTVTVTFDNAAFTRELTVEQSAKNWFHIKARSGFPGWDNYRAADVEDAVRQHFVGVLVKSVVPVA